MDKPVSPPAVAHMTVTGRIYLCVQGGGPSIHKQNFEFITITRILSNLYRPTYLDIHRVGQKDRE